MSVYDTVLDFVSHTRVKTPTAAAELSYKSFARHCQGS